MSLPLIESADLDRPAAVVAEKILKLGQKSVRLALRQWLNPTESPDAGEISVPEERLHDFRVELRRLRVWVQQTRSLVRTQRLARRDLRQASEETNPTRDLEVMLELLEQWHESLPSAPTQPVPLITEVLTQLDRAVPTLSGRRMSGLAPRARGSKTKTPRKAHRKNPEKTPGKTSDKTPHPPLRFGDWLQAQIDTQQHVIHDLMHQTDAELHQARIHVKYLRYLLEPLSKLSATAPLLAQLKQWQTALGSLNDLAVLRKRLPDLVAQQTRSALNQLLAQPGRQLIGIKSVFATQRDQLLAVTRWQTDRYQAELKQWRSQQDVQLQQLDALLDQFRPVVSPQ